MGLNSRAEIFRELHFGSVTSRRFREYSSRIAYPFELNTVSFPPDVMTALILPFKMDASFSPIVMVVEQTCSSCKAQFSEGIEGSCVARTRSALSDSESYW
jgi:hypothetical protein